jgi:putative ABC transport system permease protein
LKLPAGGIERLWADARSGLRLLVRRPGFTATAVPTLALGIGLNLAVFGFTSAMLVRPPSVPDPQSLVRLFGTDDSRPFDVLSYPNLTDVAARARTLSGLAAHQALDVPFGPSGGDEPVRVELVGDGYFPIMRVQPHRGRLLSAGDDAVAVVSHRWWRRRMAADATVVGKVVHLNGYPLAVIGVAPPGFEGSYDAFPAEFWTPLAMHDRLRPRGLDLRQRGWGWLQAVGRLRAGVTLDEANAELAVVAADLRRAHPAVNRTLGLRVTPARRVPEASAASIARVLAFLQLGAAVLLAVAGMNVAASLLVRVIAARHDTAVRLALGASAGRIARLWLAAGAGVSLLGAGGGLLLATWAHDALAAGLHPLPGFTGFESGAATDWRPVAAGALLAIACTAVVASGAAVQAGRTSPAFVLRDQGPLLVTGGRGARWRSAFVGGQIAVSLMLLVASSLLLRSHAVAAALDPGFDTRDLVVATVDFEQRGVLPETGAELATLAADRLRARAGVKAVTLAMVVPLDYARESRGVRIQGREVPDGGSAYVSIDTNIVAPDYFSTLGIPLRQGRGFQPADAAAGAAPVAVVNEAMARRFWPDGSPIGRRFKIEEDQPWVEVVGVVRDITYYVLGEPALPYLYLPLGRFAAPSLNVHVRAAGGADALAGPVARELRARDPRLAPVRVATFETLHRTQLLPRRMLAGALTALGGLALLLTALGLYGVLAHEVGRRRREIGLRIALGARPGQVLGLVLGEVLAVAGVGAIAGALAAVALSHLMRSWLLGVSPLDPASFALAALAVVLAAVAAAYGPARRAAHLHPVEALRS